MSVASQSTVKAKRVPRRPPAIRVKRLTKKQMRLTYEALDWALNAVSAVSYYGPQNPLYIPQPSSSTQKVLSQMVRVSREAVYGAEDDD